ncbi:nuclear transport factor 2 family protein [Sphingobacterium sp. Mn56C]|uniref:nuclear transport factor 2 family protein n=1 Tax=Sphingobacterium sp. Mn56C TaxID=3395261 RepID=UPI003BE9CD29
MIKQGCIILISAAAMVNAAYAQQVTQNNKEEVFMKIHTQEDVQRRVVQTYYEKIRTGNFNAENDNDLFTPEVKVFFPKIGFAQGSVALDKISEQVRQFFNSRSSFEPDHRNFIVTGNTVVVEELYTGAIDRGDVQANTGGLDGKFCMVFEFVGNRIDRVYGTVDRIFEANARVQGLGLNPDQPTDPKEITEQQTRTVVTDFFDIQSGKKQGVVTELFADVVDFDLAGNAVKFPWVGKRGTKVEVVDYFHVLHQNIKSLKFDVEFIAIHGENAVAVGQLSSVILKYNKVFNAQFVNIFKVRDGKIVKYHFMEDSYRLNEEMK